MDWPSLLAGAFIGIAVNLVTPSVQRALRSLIGWSGAGLTRLTARTLRRRLDELQKELTLVQELQANPSKLVARVTAELATLSLVTWFILCVGFFAFVQPGGAVIVPNYWWGALGGLFGASSRYAISAAAVWTLAAKVGNADEYVQKNYALQRRIQTLLARETSG